MRPSAHPRLRRALLLLALSLGLFAALTIAVWALPSKVDEAAIAGLAGARTPEGVAAARLLTRIGDRWSTVLLTIGAVVALLVFARRRAAAFLTITVAGAGLLNSLAKWAVDRPRPSIVEPVYRAAGLSFPSGHSMASFALFVGLWLIARHERLPYARATLVLAALVVPIVGFTRSYLGVHYPTDVVAGWALAGAWVTLVHTWYVRHAPWAEPDVSESDDQQAPPELLR